MRGLLLIVLGSVVLGSVGVAGCRRTPSCEDALDHASKLIPSLANPEKMSLMVAACIKEQWSAALRACMAEARDEPDLDACAKRYLPRAAKSSAKSKIDLARIGVMRYAFEAYPMWSVAHPDKECPDGLADLNEHIDSRDTNDPWGRPYRMMCGANLPAGAKGLAVISIGEDGTAGTADDIKSWE